MIVFLVFLLSITVTACSHNKSDSNPTNASITSRNETSITSNAPSTNAPSTNAVSDSNTWKTASSVTMDNKNDSVLAKAPSDNTTNVTGMALKAYKAVLQNKSEFYSNDENKNIYFKDFLVNNDEFGCSFKILHFAVLGMDDNKIPGVVIELGIGSHDYAGFYEVLHYADGKVYGDIFPIRCLEDVKDDGTFISSGSASDNSCEKLKFQGSICGADEIAYEKRQDNIEVYFIDNKEVTSDEFDSFKNEQNAKKEPTWCEFSQDNIDKEFSYSNNSGTPLYQKYMGTWNTTDTPNHLTIWESNNTYKLELGIFKITTINATAEIEKNNKLKFSDTDEPDINGTLEFNENSILVTIDKSDFEYIKAGTTYNFTVQVSSDNPSETTNTPIKCDDQLCTADENVLFSFKTENFQKVLSICEAKNHSYIVYRYGTKNNIELEYPKVKTNSWSEFTYSYDDTTPSVPTNYLSFENRGYSYVISESKSSNAKGQLKVEIDITDLSTEKEVAIIKGQSGSVIGGLSSLRSNAKIRVY